ncbi:uncharacterized protein LOC134815279 isoform X2 [Bolinopsis microptera]|uniref:uncharacterized protein LOC134815279 isoform X2 n=1 Tax=Bolinopsis microptera TaxID=2820187 RepID=UPI003079FEE8
MHGRHVTNYKMFYLILLLPLLPRPAYQVCLPQYDYMVNLYEESQDNTSSKTKVHSFASNGQHWTGNSLDFTFYIGSKESDLTVLKAELVVISHEKLKEVLMLSAGERVRVTVIIHFLRRGHQQEFKFPIFNETFMVSGEDSTMPSGYISANLTPYMRRESLDFPRFRVKVLVHDVSRQRLPYTAQDILQEDTSCTTPFIVITTSKKQELAYVTNIIERKKRGATGFTPDSQRTIQYKDVTPLEIPAFPCQKVKFDLNLADIGWDSWMLIPKMVDIGVCQGTCTNMDMLIPHALAKHKIAQMMPNEKIGKICCQEASYKEIVALYQIDGSLVKSILPQFVVNACRCR